MNVLRIEADIESLKSVCFEELCSQGFGKDSVSYEVFLHMRYQGTDCALMCMGADNTVHEFTTKYGDFYQTFIHK